jgi:phenol 2-monooxygenase
VLSPYCVPAARVPFRSPLRQVGRYLNLCVGKVRGRGEKDGITRVEAEREVRRLMESERLRPPVQQRGSARPELLHTYSAERQAIARELIDFDRGFSKRFRGREPVDPDEFQRYFAAQGRFTAGVATRYAPSMITAKAPLQHLAEGFRVGKRFHSARVVRVADAKPVHLGHAARADGAWRIYIFADRNDSTGETSRARELCEFLESDASPIKRFTPAGADSDAVIDVRAVFQQGHRDLALAEMPPALLPRKGRFGLVDSEKIFCPDPAAGDIFELRGVDRDTGCMVVVRPDQYVSQMLPLDGYDALVAFFAGILVEPGRLAPTSPHGR